MNALPAPAARLARFGMNPFAAIGQRITELAALGKDIIRVDMGSPDLPPPEPVIEMLARSAQDPTHHGYAPYRGEPAFRKAVAAYYARRFGATLDPLTEVLPLIGSKEGIVNLAEAYLDRGDAALIPDIAYPSYAAGTLMVGAEPIFFPIRHANGYLPDFNELARLPDLARAKLLWINYPNNPTGAVTDLAFYERAVAFAREHNLLLCSDNPYVDVCFDSYRAPSVMQVPGAKECSVEFMSLSKSHNMAGWRIAACVGNREALNHLLHIKSTLDSASFRPIYDAATVALDQTPQSWIDARNQRYQERRDRILAALPQIGLEAEPPRGSLYIWARITNGMTDREYTTAALEKASVSITPGTTYGGEGIHYVRFSLGISETRLDEALDRLRAWHRDNGL